MVAGVVSDEETLKAKGPTVYTCEEWAFMIRECKWVHEVALDVEYTPTIELLDRLNCEAYAHGDDIAFDADGNDACGIMKKAGWYREFKWTKGVSTTNIVGKLLLKNR